MLNDILGGVSKYFNRSLFDKSVISTAGGNDGYYVIRIDPISNGVRDTNTYYKNTGANSTPDTKNTGVVGILEKFPVFSLNATWSEQGSLTNVAPAILNNKLAGFAGGAVSEIYKLANRGGYSDTGAVFESKKIYHRSGYLDLDVSFKVINWTGEPENSPIHVALTLLSYTLPVKAFDLWDYLKNNLPEIIQNARASINSATESAKNGNPSALGELSNLVTSLGSGIMGAIPSNLKGALKDFGSDVKQGWNRVATEASNLPTEAKAGAKKAADTPIDSVTGANAGDLGKAMMNSAKYAGEYLSDYGIFRKAPSQVNVKIGKFFENHDMIIENVSINFSQEMTQEGPLWAEFTVKMSSRTIIMDMADLGFKIYAGNQWNKVTSQTDAINIANAPVPASLGKAAVNSSNNANGKVYGAWNKNTPGGANDFSVVGGVQNTINYTASDFGTNTIPSA